MLTLPAKLQFPFDPLGALVAGEYIIVVLLKISVNIQWRKAKGTIIFSTFSLSNLGPIGEIFVTKGKGCITFNKGHPSSSGISQVRFKGQLSDLQEKQVIPCRYNQHTLNTSTGVDPSILQHLILVFPDNVSLQVNKNFALLLYIYINK